MTLHEVFTLLSLGLTPMAIIGSAAVVYLWWKGTLVSFRKAHKTETDWFIIGVSISFIGATFDNLYWGVAWASSFLSHPFIKYLAL